MQRPCRSTLSRSLTATARSVRVRPGWLTAGLTDRHVERSPWLTAPGQGRFSTFAGSVYRVAAIVTHCDDMDRSAIPPCDIVDPDGRRLTVHPHASTDTIADLAIALGLPESMAVTVDGRRVARDRRLLDSGLRFGSVISASSPAAAPDADPDAGRSLDARWQIAVTAGPACSPWRPLPVGRHVIGRAATATIPIADPTVEAHHGSIEVDEGAVWFTQLTGRIPARLDGQCCTGATPLRPGAGLQLGSTVIEVRRLEPVVAGAGVPVRRSVAPAADPWRRVVRRGPPTATSGSTPDPDDRGAPIRIPTPPPERAGPPATGLIGAAVAVGGAGVMALVIGQLFFAMFAAIGAAATVATWAVGAATARRARRRARRRHRVELATFHDAIARAHAAAVPRHRTDHPAVADLLGLLQVDSSPLWARRRDATEPLRVTVARGPVRWQPPFALAGDDRRDGAPDWSCDPALTAAAERHGVLHDVSVPLTIAPGVAVALHGDRDLGTSLARSIVVQAAVAYGPADWRLVVVTDRPADWSWTTWLPHATAPIDVADERHTDRLRDVAARPDASRWLIVTDVADALTVRTSPARRLLAAGAACIVVVPEDASPPAVSTIVVAIGADGCVHWPSGRFGSPFGATMTGISPATATEAARALAPLVDPEGEDRAGGLASQVTLRDLGLTCPTPQEIADTWRSAGSDPPLSAAIGRADDGVVVVDLARDGPHGLVAGTTGAGKSELLRTLVGALAARLGPDQLSFVLVDFKGGSTFDACARLPHVVGLVTDLDDHLAERALVSLDAEVRRREGLLRSVGAEDLSGFRRISDGALPRLVVIVDEFATLAKELPEFLSSLVGIAQRGRSLGVHLILATQRPAGVVTDEIRTNTNLRIALRVGDRSDAIDVVGDGRPAAFPRAVPGRAALRLGGDDLVVFQAASCTGPLPPTADRLRVEPAGSGAAADRLATAPTELSRLVDAIEGAALLVPAGPPHRPWLPPLPARLDPDDVEDSSGGRPVGVVDDPAQQAQRPLRWDPATGNLLVVGSMGSGTTSTAVAIVGSCVRSQHPASCHIYVIDGRGDRCWDDIGLLDHCGAVVRLPESERLVRLVDRLADELARRLADGSTSPQVVLVVDGVDPVRAALGGVGLGEPLGRFDRVLADGPPLGIATCIVSDGTSMSSLTAPAVHRWVHHVADPAIARAAGLGAPPPPAGAPGRIRVVASGLEAQVVLDPLALGSASIRTGAGGPPPVDVLAERVDPAALAAAPDGTTERGTALAVGLGSSDLATAHLMVPVGDHVFVGGAARSGKTTAVEQIRASWQQCHPRGRVLVVTSDAGADDVAALDDLQSGAGRGSPTLVVVDDADRIDDSSGALARLAEGRRSDVTIVAAARVEAVRAAYGHWVRSVTRSRCGLLLTSIGELDGELLGATLPRRSVIAPRPGLAWMVDGSGPRLVQVAARMPG